MISFFKIKRKGNKMFKVNQKVTYKASYLNKKRFRRNTYKGVILNISKTHINVLWNNMYNQIISINQSYKIIKG